MADTVLAMEKPKKAKRTKPKSAKSKEEDIPLADMDGGPSDLKFNQLLQQAVGQSIGAAKAEKKKKKKKPDESVLESLRKGEGIQKDRDSSVIANTYDPADSPKYEKSNMKKQKLREDRLRHNELEIVDEPQGKQKKKKKLKPLDEKIENLDISEMAVRDKTMTMSELDTTKTPGKKKKKKPEEEPAVSVRTEDETSPKETTAVKKKKKKPVVEEDTVLTGRTEDSVMTPTKKKKKPVRTEEESETVITDRTEDSVMTPTKRKKKKSVAEEIIDSGRTEEEVVTPKKKKKKPVPGEEPESARTEDEETTPKKRVKKKKKPTEETEDEELLSPSEEPSLAKDKKKKKGKKGKTDDEEGPLSGEEVTSPKGKKKKKKKGEETEEEGAMSPEEDPTSPKGKKKKKKKKDEATEEEPDEEEEEAPKPKPRKKKKKKGEQTAEEEEEAVETPGRDVEDEGRILAVTIHRTDKLKNDFYILHPMVRVHVVNEDTGQYLVKQHKDRAVTAFYETENQKVTQVLPIMTKPFDFKQQKSVLPVWEELLIFNENYNYFVQDKPKVIIFFELLDFVSMSRTAQRDGHEKGWHRIAWAFLKVVGNNKKINTGSKVRLQLFEPPTGIRRIPDLVELFQWWQSGSRKPYASTLYVTLKGIIPPDEVEPAHRSMFATQGEIGKLTYKDLKASINLTGKAEQTKRVLSSWSRLAGQLCRLPNTLALALPTAKKGCFAIKFSHDGRSLACACQGKEGHPILVYEIPSGSLRGKFTGHFGIVYDMCWSKRDTQLLTASSDGTVRVWDIQNFGDLAEKLLPHPSFVYTAQFHPRVDTIVATGGFDQVIRVWDVGSDEHDGGILRQELEDHIGYVNSICFDDDGQKMYSADSVGVIIIWNSFFTEQPSKRGIARDWTVYKKIEDPEIKNTAINMIRLHPSGRRLLVHCRDNILRMFDLRIQRVMQKYIGALNFREQIRSAVTPCGSFVFSGSEDHYAYAWNTDTGDQVIMYSELNYQHPVTDVDYHPRDHMVAFCSLGENHPILLYSYDAQIAQMDAGLSPRQISPIPAEMDTMGTPRLAEELAATKGVLTKEEFQLHTSARFEKVMRTLNKVTTQMGTTPMLDLPGMAAPVPAHTGMMTMSSTGYDMYGSTPRSMMASPQAFSPHARPTMASTMQQQQFASQNLYMKATDSWRPTFSEDISYQDALGMSAWEHSVGRQGSRSTSPVLGRAPTLNLTAASGKAQFNFQAPPGKAVPKYEKVVALYDYRAQRSDELNLFSGDVINILYKDNENWWMGELPDGQQGFFPANYVAEEDTLLDSHRQNMMTSDPSELRDSKSVTAVTTKSGELKFLSGAEESEDDLLESNRTRRRKKNGSQDGSVASGSGLQSSLSRKPPRTNNHKVRINEPSESNA